MVEDATGFSFSPPPLLKKKKKKNSKVTTDVRQFSSPPRPVIVNLAQHLHASILISFYLIFSLTSQIVSVGPPC